MKSLNDYDVIIFDLDGTLYDEADYIHAANVAIKNYVNKKYKIDLGAMLETSNYTSISGLIGRNITEECLEIRRTVKADLKLFPEMKSILGELKGKRVVILTNGNPQQQKNKIDQLDWPYHIPVVYANLIEPKPSPKGIEHILKMYGSNAVFMGNSVVDQDAAINANIPFLWSQQ